MRIAYYVVLLLLFAPLAKAQVTCTVLQNVSCADENGVISAVASFGVSPYTYSIDGGANYQNTGYFAFLSPGTYTITAKDATGTTATGTATLINIFSQPRISATYTNPSSCAASDGTITATASGGTPPYQYSLDQLRFQSSGTFYNLPQGQYNVIVKDANGCIATAEGPWLFASCPTISGGQGIGEVGCTTKGTITITTAPNDTRSYLYSLDGINFQSTPQFTGLDVGIYYLTIKDVAGDIDILEGITVTSSCGFTIDFSTVNTTCTSTGSITAQAFGSTAPYQYSLDGIHFQSSNVFSNLSPGHYPLVAKDANGATTSKFLTIYNGCVTLSVNADNTTCGQNNGKITATPTNGVPSLQYSIDGTHFQYSNIFTGLSAATYQVTVKDADGNTAVTSANIAGSSAPQVTVLTDSATCSENDGSIIINASGGTPLYQYSIDNINFQSGSSFSNLSQGEYTAIVKDANGCVSNSYAATISLVCYRVTATTTDAHCNNNDGSIAVSTVDGIAPYQYSIDGINFQTGSAFPNLLPGNYTVTVKDANNAIATTQAIVNNTCISISNTIVSSTCGNPNGSIQVAATDGAAPYSYSIDGINFQNSNIFSGLVAGPYTITVKDANGLTNSIPAVVTTIAGPSFSAINTTAASCDNNDGTATILAIGGTAPLQYSITGTTYQDNNSFSALSSGDHTIVVKDANGCTTSQVTSIPLNSNLTLIPGSDLTICQGTSATLTITSNGTTFAWSPTASLNNPVIENPVASPSVTTQYSVTATTGVCTRTEAVNVFVNPAPVADAGQGTVICFGQDAQLNGGGGIMYSWAPATYLSDPGISNPAVLKPAATTTYSLSVTDANNCTSLQKDEVTITVTPPAKLFAGNDTSIAINQPLQLLAEDVNNSGFTQYTWSPDYGLSNPYIANPIAVLDKNITYQVTAKTPVGCEGVGQINIKVYKGPDIYVPNAFTPNGDGRNDILKPIPVGLKEFRLFIVYNRWGQVMFRSSNASVGWDGTINGVKQSTGSYVWIAEGVDYNGNIIQRKGTVVLIL